MYVAIKAQWCTVYVPAKSLVPFLQAFLLAILQDAADADETHVGYHCVTACFNLTRLCALTLLLLARCSSASSSRRCYHSQLGCRGKCYTYVGAVQPSALAHSIASPRHKPKSATLHLAL
jgi:hypothetical protein